MSDLRVNRRQAEMLVEKAKRQIFALDMFRAQPHQDAIFECTSRELLVRGGVRAGKSLALAILCAAIIMDKEITLSDGRKVRPRQMHHRDKMLLVWIIGFDQRHIGETIHRLLFRPGAFKIIFDHGLGQWRAYDQTNPLDSARENEAKPSPPLIPARFIKPKSWNWCRAAAKQFDSVTIRDPITKIDLAEICAYGSKQDPKQGDPVHYIWIDEAIQNPAHYAEWQSRIADYRGQIRWSSWPRANNPALRALTQRAKDEIDNPRPIVKEIILTTSQNAQLDPQGKADLIAGFSPEERLARDKGEYLLESLRMYPLFDAAIHAAYQTCPECVRDLNARCVCRESDDELAAILRRNRGQPPDDWTRELILDPGTSNPAVLFCAIPPKSMGDYLVPYMELYPGRKDAEQLAPLVKQHVGRHLFNRFIIDFRAGRQTPMGFGHTIKSNYEQAFKKLGLRCAVSGSTFSFGSDNVGGRMMALQSTMHLDSKGKPSLRIVSSACPSLCKQLNDIIKDEANDQVVDDRPAKGQKIDLHDCLCYWVASRPFYVKPAPASAAGPIWDAVTRFKDRMRGVSEGVSTWGPQYESA